MSHSIFGFKKWLPEAKKSVSADLLAGLTVWAMIVPESVAYAGIANAPSTAAGMYGIMIGLPIFALFTSSRLLVATSTAAVSATTAALLAAASGNPQAMFPALVIAAGIAFLIFYYFRLGFLADFISAPVSRGFMVGLSIFIIVGQLPKALGVEKGTGNTFSQLWTIVREANQINPVTLAIFIAVLGVLVGGRRISRKLPAGMIAMMLCVLVFALSDLAMNQGVKVVGALPSGLPVPVLPAVNLASLFTLIAGSIGLVIVATSEFSVIAQTVATEHNRHVSINREFLAFGAANIFAGMFGGLMAAGSTSSTMVNDGAGAKTPMSMIWAAVITLFTLLFLTGLFAYVPEAFLAALIIHAVWHLVKFHSMLEVRRFSKAEFRLAAIAFLAVLIFDVLNGLLIAMLLNILYSGYRTSQVKLSEFGLLGSRDPLLVPMSIRGVRPVPSDCVAFGVTRGMVFYASARSVYEQAREILRRNPDAKNIIMSVERLSAVDFTSNEVFEKFQDLVRRSGKKLFITNIHDPALLKQLQDAKFDPNLVDVSVQLDVRKIGLKDDPAV